MNYIHAIKYIGPSFILGLYGGYVISKIVYYDRLNEKLDTIINLLRLTDNSQKIEIFPVKTKEDDVKVIKNEYDSETINMLFDEQYQKNKEQSSSVNKSEDKFSDIDSSQIMFFQDSGRGYATNLDLEKHRSMYNEKKKVLSKFKNIVGLRYKEALKRVEKDGYTLRPSFINQLECACTTSYDKNFEYVICVSVKDHNYDATNKKLSNFAIIDNVVDVTKTN